jgi:transposase-like protein
MKAGEVDKIPPLTAGQQELLVALVEERTVAAAARQAGVHRSSYYRWLELPAFRVEVGRIRRHQFEEALDLLNAGQAKAVARLLEALDSKDQGIRLRAATSVVQLGLDVTAGLDRERRISELEERAGLARVK